MRTPSELRWAVWCGVLLHRGTQPAPCSRTRSTGGEADSASSSTRASSGRDRALHRKAHAIRPQRSFLVPLFSLCSTQRSPAAQHLQQPAGKWHGVMLWCSGREGTSSSGSSPQRTTGPLSLAISSGSSPALACAGTQHLHTSVRRHGQSLQCRRSSAGVAVAPPAHAHLAAGPASAVAAAAGQVQRHRQAECHAGGAAPHLHPLPRRRAAPPHGFRQLQRTHRP